MKLNELKSKLNEGIDPQADAKLNYEKDVTGQLSSLISKAIQMGVVDPNINNAAPVNTASTNAAPVNAAPAGETPEQKRIRLQKASQQNIDKTATPVAPKATPEQIRQQRQAQATQAARAGMTTRENKRIERLNSLFENIININEADAPMSISAFVQNKIGPITRSNMFTTSPYKEEVQKIADAIQASYAQDKGQVGIQALANYTWNMLVNGRRGRMSAGSSTATAASTAAPATSTAAPATSTAVPTAVPTAAPTAAPAASPEAAATSKIGVRQINKIIPTLRKRDLLSVKKNVDNTLNGRGGTTASTAAPVDAGASAFGQMANTLSGANTSKSSTGGTTTKTPTGRIHTAKPQAAAAAAPEKDNVIKMPKGKAGRVRASREGGVTPEEQANFDRKVQQAMAAQSK